MTPMNEWLRGVDPNAVRRWAAVGVAGVILVILANVFFQAPPATVASAGTRGRAASAQVRSDDALMAYEAQLDQEVATSLEAIQGAGKVRVSVTLAGSPSRQYVLNTTQHQDQTQSRDAQGGTQTQTSTETTGTLAAGSNASPVLMREIGPEVVGVLVVASGASDPVVRDDLFQATATLLGVPAYKVMVLP